MALKLNIRSDIEEEMDALLPRVHLRSKTEYINCAIAAYNRKLKRELELDKLKGYFKNYQTDAQEIMDDFEKIRPPDC